MIDVHLNNVWALVNNVWALTEETKPLNERPDIQTRKPNPLVVP